MSRPVPPGDREPAEDMEDADPALARERTDLAWTRSAIAFFGVGVAILKFRPAIGIPVLAIAGAIWLIGRTVRTPARGIASARPLFVTVAVTLLALVSLVLTLAGPASRGLRP